jgi:hypothetical protein
MKQYIPVIALIVSVIAIIISIMNFKAADIAVAKRERQLVAHMTPQVEAIARDLFGTNAPFAKPPETIEELLAPLITTISNIGK